MVFSLDLGRLSHPRRRRGVNRVEIAVRHLPAPLTGLLTGLLKLPGRLLFIGVVVPSDALSAGLLPGQARRRH